MIITYDTRNQLRRGDVIECVNLGGQYKGIVLGTTEDHFFYVHVYPRSQYSKYTSYRSAIERSFWSDYTRGVNHVVKTGESESESRIREILDDKCLTSSYAEIPSEFLTPDKLKLDNGPSQTEITRIFATVIASEPFFGPWK